MHGTMNIKLTQQTPSLAANRQPFRQFPAFCDTRRLVNRIERACNRCLFKDRAIFQCLGHSEEMVLTYISKHADFYGRHLLESPIITKKKTCNKYTQSPGLC